MDVKQTGGFIRLLRKEKGLTQEELAHELNVTNKTISRWETGSGYPDVDSMMALSDYFGISVNELLLGRRKVPADPVPGPKTDESSNTEEIRKKEQAQIACDSLDLSVKKRRFSRVAAALAVMLAVVLLISTIVIATIRRDNRPEPPIPETPVLFSSPLVEKEIRNQLGRMEGELFPSDLKKITSIVLYDGRFDDLSDLEKLPFLSSLVFSAAEITDPSPIGRLSALRTLYVEDSVLSDISFLSELTGLRKLRLIRDGITDISPLAGLMSLQVLSLDGNKITDISPLLGLSSLTSLSASWNPIVPEQVTVLRAALTCKIECSVSTDASVTLWPIDADGDGKKEYIAADMLDLAAGSAQIVLLNSEGILIDQITEYEIDGVHERIAIVYDAVGGECILLECEVRNEVNPAYQLFQVRDGKLCIVEWSEERKNDTQDAQGDDDRLCELYRNASILFSTDGKGLIDYGAYRKDTGEFISGGTCGYIGAAELPQRVKERIEEAGFVVIGADIGLNVTS